MSHISMNGSPKYYSSVLFACLGNVIRSPLCEGLLRNLTNGILVDSAAVTDDDVGCHPYLHAQRIAKEHGYDISKHVSRLIQNEDFNKFGLIVSLEQAVYNELVSMKPKAAKAEIVQFAPYAIDNPWCNPYEDFVDMYDQIDKEMKVFLKKYIDPVKIK